MTEEPATSPTHPLPAQSARSRLRLPGAISRPGLRTKIVIWAFVPTAIILVAVALVTFNAYREVTGALVIERDRELTRLSASQLSTEISRFNELLDPWARTAFLYEGDLGYLQLALEDADHLGVFDGGVIVFDNLGNVLVTWPDRPEIVGQNWADRDYVRRIMRRADPLMSGVVPDGPDGADVVVFTMPILGRQRELLGAVAGLFVISPEADNDFYASLIPFLERGRGSVILVDGSGRVIAGSDRSLIGSDLSDEDAVRQGLAGITGAERTTDSSGRAVVASFSPVPGSSWGLITWDDWAALSRASQEYMRFLLLLLLLGVAIPALIVAIGVRRITQPVNELIAAAQEIAGGDFSRRIETTSEDEIQELARQFNRMAAHLQESYARLEQRVLDRTRELAALNTLASAVSRSLDLSEILRDALGLALQVMGLDAGGIYLLDEETGQLHLIAQQGLSREFVEIVDGMNLGENFSGRVALDGQPLVVLDIAADARLDRPGLIAEGMTSTAVVPISSRGKVLGTLFAAARTRREFSEQDMELLGSIGSHIAVAVENSRLYEQARQVAVMEERTRLAHDLHDAVSQTLWTANLLADILPALLEQDPGEAQRSLDKLRQLTRGALAEMRTLLLELRPGGLVDVRLGELLRQLTEAVISRRKVEIELDVRCATELPPDTKIALYRIAQEALNNISKHAHASRAKVCLHDWEDGVQLIISDNGCGFDPEHTPPERLGLSIMRERAEAAGVELQIESQTGQGTQIQVVWSAHRVESA